MGDSREDRTDDYSDMAAADLASDLSGELRARVKSELEPGERLLWASRNRNERSVVRQGHLTTALVAAGLLIVDENRAESDSHSATEN
jgi:hypothetical protein